MQTLDYTSNQFKNVTTIGNTVITGAQVLLRVIINTKGSSSNIAKIYNGVTADSQNLIANIDLTVSPSPFEYNIPCVNGILIVTSAGTQADLTVVYRPL